MARHRKNKSEADAFRMPGESKLVDQSRIMSRITRESMRAVLGDAVSDTRSYRHLFATAALYACLPDGDRESIGSVAGLSKLHVPALLNELPPRMHYRYFSRQLGHAYVDTTLIHYTHLVPVVVGNQDGCFVAAGNHSVNDSAILSKNLLVHLLDSDWEAVRKRRARSGCYWRIGDGQRRGYVLPYPDRIATNRDQGPQQDELPDGESKDSREAPVMSFGLLGEIALRQKMQIGSADTALELGLADEVASDLYKELQKVNRRLGLRYLPPDKASGVATHKRRPRQQAAIKALHELDCALEQSKVSYRQLLAWCGQQLDVQNTLVVGCLPKSVVECLPVKRCFIGETEAGELGELLVFGKNRDSNARLLVLAINAGVHLNLLA